VIFDDFLNPKPERKRTPIPRGKQREAIRRASTTRCENCHQIIPKDVKEEIHHKDGNPNNNKDSNIQVLCPNCHSIISNKQRKKRQQDQPSQRPKSEKEKIFGPKKYPGFPY